MYIVVKHEFVYLEEPVLGSTPVGETQIVIDRIVNSLEEVKSGEVFFKCNVKE